MSSTEDMEPMPVEQYHTPLPDPWQAGGDLAPQAFLSGYQGSSITMARGQVWWPDLNTETEFDAFTREEGLRRCRFLAANVGLAKGFIRNSAELVGHLRPCANTGDKEWDAKADLLFKMRSNRLVFDAAGKFSFASAQLMLQRISRRDGDLLPVLTESPSGAGRLAFYEAHQLQSPAQPRSNDKWKDGVRENTNGRHMAYAIDRGKKRRFIVPAMDALYFGEIESPRHPRAIPPLMHAINNGLDRTEVIADIKKAIKRAGLSSGYVTTAVGGKKTRVSMPGALGPRELTIQKPDGTKARATIEDIWASGQMPELGEGQKVELVHDTRPHPNTREFLEDLVRDMSVGFGLHPEIIWNVGELKGPGVRFALDLADRWIATRLLALLEWCQRVWVYMISKEIKAGRLEEPPVDDWMQRVKFVRQRSLTIDRGRDGKTRLQAYREGLGAKADMLEDFEGRSHAEVTRERVLEKKREIEACHEEGLPYLLVYPEETGTAADRQALQDFLDEEEATLQVTEEEKEAA